MNAQLKAPGSASYPDCWDFDGEVSVSGSGRSWMIASHVDAENSFGGEVRTRWVCDASLSGDRFTALATIIG